MSEGNELKELDERISRSREMIEHEALMFYSIFDAARKAGLDFESVLREAVKACSHYEGEDIAGVCSNLDNLEEFGKSFADEFWSAIHDMETVEAGEDRLRINFHSCSYVAAWKKIGVSSDDMKLLCDILMDGDRCIAKNLNYEFVLGKTIAGGNQVCELDFKK